MEELLNKLIKKWWKPFGWDDKLSSLHKEYGVWKWYIRFHNWMDSELFDLRQLVSKESGLWQFCCESKIIEQWKTVHDFVMKHICYADENRCWWFSMCNAEYYIMMCSLLEESELEQFLLDNIKI